MAFNPMKHRIPVLKRLVPSIRKRLAKVTSKNGFTLKTSHGMLFLLNISNYVDRQIAFYDDFEFEQTRYLFGRMKDMGCDLFLDVGANIGFYSVNVARRNLAGRVVAFEPDIRNKLQFHANIGLNDVHPAITVIDKAVSDHDGTVSFYAAPATTTGQSRVSDADGNLTVDCVRLDSVIDDRGKRIAVKIDVEGYELSVIHGMKALVANNAVLFQIECFPQNLEKVTAALAEMGVRPIHQIDDDHYFTNVAA